MAAKPSNRKKPDPGENHPSRRKKIPPSKEVNDQTERNRGFGRLPKKGAKPNPLPGRPLLTMPLPPLGGFRDPDRTPWNQPGLGGNIYNSTVNPRNKNLGGMLNLLRNWRM